MNEARAFKDLKKDEFTYSFDKIIWMVTDQENAGNKINFEFDKFSRREPKNYVNFLYPFYVGNFKGECLEFKGNNPYGYEI